MPKPRSNHKALHQSNLTGIATTGTLFHIKATVVPPRISLSGQGSLRLVEKPLRTQDQLAWSRGSIWGFPKIRGLPKGSFKGLLYGYYKGSFKGLYKGLGFPKIRGTLFWGPYNEDLTN